MAFNVAGAVEVPLEVFGGKVSEMAPADLPEGVSPDCSDCGFVPGSVSQRAALEREFTNPYATATFTYEKSFVTPTGAIKNLYMASDGMLLVEDPINSPGIYVPLQQFTPGSYAKSCTAFGREYIAISDTLHGSDIPLQYDGTYLDRVTQDGPCTAPQVQNVAYGAVPLLAGPPGPPVPIDIITIQIFGYRDNPNLLLFQAVDGPIPTPGTQVTVTGNSVSAFNGTWTVIPTPPPGPTQTTPPIPLPLLGNYFFALTTAPQPAPIGTGGSFTNGVPGGAVLQRNNNLVTGQTTLPHNLKPGYQALIANVAATKIGGGITGIVIDNEDNPGIAVITTAMPHGLVPGNDAFIQFVPPTNVGGGIGSTVAESDIITINTNTPHGLSVGSIVNVVDSGGTPGAVDGQWTVKSVPTPTSFTYVIQNYGHVGTSSTGGQVLLMWPSTMTGNPDDNLFSVQETPSPTSFWVSITYTDGVWGAGGSVSFPWDGTFFVASTPSPTTFTYQEYGPSAIGLQAVPAVSTVTPNGQIAPGMHGVRISYLTRQGQQTRPGPFVLFEANGGNYMQLTNLPIGPANVAARIIEVTGAQGAYYFYIPVPAQVNGVLVATATQVNDNVTTSVILDFSDNTLFAGLGTSTPGNNTPTQIVLDGALGFGYYGSRLLTCGQRNTVQSLLNMGFEGGALPPTPTLPTGWTASDSNPGALTPVAQGLAWIVNVPATATPCGQLSQPVYADVNGSPIIQPNTQYTYRLKLTTVVTGQQFIAILSSASTGLTLTATIDAVANPVPGVGAYYQADFSGKTPAVIPNDMTLTIYAIAAAMMPVSTLQMDEMNLIYTATPYLDTIGFGSYVNNPEAFAGITGKFGAVADTRKLMDFAVMRQSLYLLTQDPSGRLHQTSDNGVTEPVGWTVNEVAANCGVLSAFATTRSQADDASASGGEEWLAWASSAGARIFGGDQPNKISQEIQPDWDQINPAANSRIWALNDPTQRYLYFGLPLGAATAPSKVYAMSYLENDSAQQIAGNAPFRISFSGKMIATDNARKWCPWNLTINAAALMYRSAGVLSTIFAAGNGQTPGIAAGYGNVYSLNPNKYTDDDYGQIFSYYVTYFFVSREAEIALQLGAHRKMLAYLTAYVSGVGNVLITAFTNTLSNPWNLTCTRTLYADPLVDLEWPGAYVLGQRIAIKVQPQPANPEVSLDNYFNLQRLMCALVPAKKMPVRGAVQ